MVFAVELKTRKNLSGLSSFLKKIEEAANTVVVSGVINGDSDATKKAALNEFGGTGIYESGPYKGEKVQVPARPFVKSAIEHHQDEVIKVASESIDLENDPNLVQALHAVGRKVVELQTEAINSNGEGIPGWQKHNSQRTIETKGFDKPLFNRYDETFPIDYELQKRSA